MKTKDLNENYENFNGIWVLSSLKKTPFPSPYIYQNEKAHDCFYRICLHFFVWENQCVLSIAYTSQNLYMDCKD